jgi:ankyrin repeat protein
MVVVLYYIVVTAYILFAITTIAAFSTNIDYKIYYDNVDQQHQQRRCTLTLKHKQVQPRYTTTFQLSYKILNEPSNMDDTVHTTSSSSSYRVLISPSKMNHTIHTMVNKYYSYNRSHSNRKEDQEQQLLSLRRIPYEQRVTQPRVARRMNHPFKYLYRHGFDDLIESNMKDDDGFDDDDDDDDDDDTRNIEDPYIFLKRIGNYTNEQIKQMNDTFPILLQLSVRQQLYPKLQFLKHTMQQSTPSCNNTTYPFIPPSYYGIRLERIVAPRHAFLVWSNLSSGARLFEPQQIDRHSMNMIQGIDNTTTNNNNNDNNYQCKFKEFLINCRSTKYFAAMCQKWYNDDHINDKSNLVVSYTAKDIEAFDMIFGRGLLAIVRNDLVQSNNSWPIDQLQKTNKSITAAELVPLLISHGTNVYERDHRGATLLHWACGTGHWDIVHQLLPNFRHIDSIIAIRDGATILHWAAAGCSTREFGIGGHVHICEYLFEYIRSTTSSTTRIQNWINQCTYDGNSPLMWAAWSGSLETVKLLVRNKANTTVVNRNGCSVAHWAASGGNLDVCMYLYSIANIDFTISNCGGNTPLSHAVAFGRIEVVEWLLRINESASHLQNEDSILAYTLAQDFAGWSLDGKDKQERNKITTF